MIEAFSEREKKIIEWARESYRLFWNPAEKDEGSATQNSTNVHDAWQEKCSYLFCECEKGVEKSSQKFDVFDPLKSTVYEMKTSGNNPGHEFYKDIFKVLVHNKNSEHKVKKFFFLTEQKGIKVLENAMLSEIKEICKPEFDIVLVPLDQ